MRGIKTDQEAIDHIVACHKSGMMLSEVIESTGASLSTVSRVLKNTGLTIPKSSNIKYRVWEQSDADRIYGMWKQGMGIYDIIHKEHKGYSRMVRLLEQGSGRMCEKLMAEREAEKQETIWKKIKPDVEAGMAVSMIDKKYGMHIGTTASLMKEKGYVAVKRR